MELGEGTGFFAVTGAYSWNVACIYLVFVSCCRLLHHHLLLLRKVGRCFFGLLDAGMDLDGFGWLGWIRIVLDT